MPDLPIVDTARLTSEQTEAWGERVSSCVLDATNAYGIPPQLVGVQDTRATQTAITDWTAFPKRVGDCLTSGETGLLLDWRTSKGDEGRRFQEEYAEWRVSRAPDGRIVRFELTTELPEYWVWLAGEDPAGTLELVGSCAGEERLATRHIYGELDPFNRSLGPVERANAFAGEMLGDGESPYNNGLRAICCMRQPTNTLDALVGLAVASAHPRLARDPSTDELRCANAAEIIPLLDGAAEIGRNSDPVIVEHLARLAGEGRLIGFDGPPAVHVGGVQLERLSTPDGETVPADWFSLQRLTNVGSEPVLAQRLTFTVPPGQGLLIGDMIDMATGRRITSGAQLAELVQLVLYLRTSPPGEVDIAAGRFVTGAADPDRGVTADCKAIRAGWRESNLARAMAGAAR